MVMVKLLSAFYQMTLEKNNCFNAIFTFFHDVVNKINHVTFLLTDKCTVS